MAPVADNVVTAQITEAGFELRAEIARKLRYFRFCLKIAAVVIRKALPQRHHRARNRTADLSAAQASAETGGYRKRFSLVQPGELPGRRENGLSTVITLRMQHHGVLPYTQYDSLLSKIKPPVRTDRGHKMRYHLCILKPRGLSLSEC